MNRAGASVVRDRTTRQGSPCRRVCEEDGSVADAAIAGDFKTLQTANVDREQSFAPAETFARRLGKLMHGFRARRRIEAAKSATVANLASRTAPKLGRCWSASERQSLRLIAEMPQVAAVSARCCNFLQLGTLFALCFRCSVDTTGIR